MARLDHIVLQATDFSQALSFYRKLFEYIEWSEVADPNSADSCGFQHTNGPTVWLIKNEKEVLQPNAHLNHFAFHCEERQDVDRAFEFCQSQGWKIISPPAPYTQYGSFYGFAFQGPDNFKLEFVTR